ncbi:acetolactate synthase large subunit [Tropicimonas isoalkanivorans]|uniref:Acetolactate synthase-1/2/3 large subunit n=1 Tax=Tropicimonas isoalkanivorans TaxID=441112 RepID=A0A1I1PGG9_9RHOB|nr:acetolactate synthase large subunit [Tropicimonas isoalkanivorans]SFD05150.1 acetolactate synthase-1/2/3 large subunit [Tropicimonas isoalkanivorans]
MNGAECLVKTLLAGGVDVCFANPGTSEMHFVAALDSHPQMRCILGLFEGGVTGAADGYWRMTGQPAATLLHLAPGFGNGYANVHNARKGFGGMVNVVGEHADYHLKYDAPLKGDIEGVARGVSDWLRVSSDARAVAGDGADAVRAARSANGQIATLVLPANTAWDAAEAPADPLPPVRLHRPRPDQIRAAADALRAEGAALFVGGAALHGDLAVLAGKIAARTGCRLMADLFVPRLQRGAGAVAIECMYYAVLENAEILKDVRHMVLVGAGEPVAFFAYPDKPSTPTPPSCHLLDLCGPRMDIAWTLQALAEETDALDSTPAVLALDLPALPSGTITAQKVGAALAALLPENAIVVNESVTAGQPLSDATRTARRHDWLNNPGGAIGAALPLAVGAAVACPDRRVIAATGDGSAMYTLQSLWTMARERLDVTVIVFANRGYQILRGELANVGVHSVGRNAERMFNVEDPQLDWVALAAGHGVAAERAHDMDSFVAAFSGAVERPGPFLIEVCLPSSAPGFA